MNNVTIVMYHYVRDLRRSRYPAIKARDISEFRAQLDFISRTYNVVSAEEVIAACKEEIALPPNALWLTFDDGYLDHYTTVFPLLHDRKWCGSFFPPARPIKRREVLDVNKIHLILASQPNASEIISRLKAIMSNLRCEPPVEQQRRWHSPSRFDSAEVAFVKRVLQFGLSDEYRSAVVDRLFREFVSSDETAIAAELYMSEDQIKMMSRCGMHFGSHGYDHNWLDKLSPEQQRWDVARSLEFLESLGVSTKRWVMCYPYGAHNEALRSSLAEMGCSLGITTDARIADLSRDSPLALPRLDTNDLPH